MEEKQSDNQPKAGNKWESTLLFVAILLATVISIMGWYLQNDMKSGF